MEHFYLIANPGKEGTEEVAGQIMVYLQQHGASCEGQPQQVRKAGTGDGFTEAESPPHLRSAERVERIPKKTQCVITLGGDGTMIQAARDLVGRGLPLIGINMGTLGYLTQIARGEAITPMLDALLQDQYRMEKRMMLEGRVAGAGKESRSIALNDIVLTRRDVMQLLKFQVFVNDEYFNSYTADGMIVATPTGSTAYNLSAGGPIVAPGAELMVLTPICSHSINSRSIVLPAWDKVSIKVERSTFQKQMAVFDGDLAMDIASDETLEIWRSECYTTLIQLKGDTFLENLRNKMTRV